MAQNFPLLLSTKIPLLKSTRHCGGQTVREFAKLRNKEEFLAAVFSGSELASNKD